MLDFKILEAPRSIKRLVMLAADFFIIPIAIYTAIGLRTDFNYSLLSPQVHALSVITALVSAVFFMKIGLYRAVVRFMGHEALFAVVKGVTISTIVLSLFLLLLDAHLPRSIPLIYWAVAFCFVGGSRFMVREYVHAQAREQKQKIAIYGAGRTGLQLLTALQNGGVYEPVVLLDDDEQLWGDVYQGQKVCNPSIIADLVKKGGVEQVLLAMPSAPMWRRKEILENLEPLAVGVKTVPSLDQLVNGNASIDEVRDIEIEDLLGRDAVAPNVELMSACITDKNVLVTGAGGSIGSELCRQILNCNPSVLVLFERCEYALYELESELLKTASETGSQVDVIALLGCVQDEQRLSSVFESYGINTIYHAAAYKHVPMVEHNIIEGVRNNVFGTLAAANSALKAEVETFVLVSTDKAVRPTNIMGASKRFAELVLQALAEKSSTTCFSMVRFGNVLGSSGSVVPLFKQQIRNGGPITVTHPEIIRYFMTISEAAQLVIQAGSMGKGGDVFVLDMGEPVKIADLARRMVRLMGMEVKDANGENGDIEISFTGLRPGEKLYEELLIEENAAGTEHPRIMVADEFHTSWAELKLMIKSIGTACDTMDCASIHQILKGAHIGYDPKDGVNDYVWCKGKANSTVLSAAGRFREKVAQ